MKYLYLFLCFLWLPAFAQNNVPGKTENRWLNTDADAVFSAGKIPAFKNDKELENNTLNFLQKKYPVLFSNGSGVQLQFNIKSILGAHLTFCQTYYGTEIYLSQIKMNLKNDGTIMSVISKTVNTTNWQNFNNFPMPDVTLLQTILDNPQKITYKKIVYPTNNSAEAAWKIETANTFGAHHFEYVINTQYNILYKTDKNVYFSNIDTLVKAWVFLPDPLTFAQKKYAHPYVDSNNADIPELNAARVKVDMYVTFENDTFKLKGPYAQIVDLAAPYNLPAVSTTAEFNFTRAQPQFEEVNAFFHIHNFQQHIQKLGFTLAKFPLRVDAHATEADNSQFLYFNDDFKIFFGDGNVNDAEDADVVIHEYSHCLSWMASPHTLSGTERRTLDEALGDYFACSYSRFYSEYEWEKVFNWDGNFGKWQGRRCQTYKRYPEDLTGSIYTDGEIWTSSLMRMWEYIGRDTTDRLMLATLYTLSNSLKLTDAAKLFLQADSILSGGIHTYSIHKAFAAHGLMPELDVSIEENNVVANLTRAWFSTEYTVTTEFSKPVNGNVALYDLQGRQIAGKPFKNQQHVNLNLPVLQNGIYVLRYQTNQKSGIEKLIKF